MNRYDRHIPSDLKELIDTAALRGSIGQLQTFGYQTGHGRALIRKIRKALRRMMGELSLMEMFNRKVWLKFNMLTDPGWREQVLGDLGGEPALRKWEGRKVRADREVLEPRIVPYTPQADDNEMSDTDAPKRTNVKCDRDGMFRLAPISFTIRPLTLPEEHARWEAKSYRRVMRLVPRARAPKPSKHEDTFRPIPLTPGELRGETVKRTKTWEQVHAEDAADVQKERDYIKALINAAEPHQIVKQISEQTFNCRSSQRKLGPCSNPEQDIPDQVWDNSEGRQDIPP